MRILLTGPTGFIGSAFAKLSLSRGHEIAGLIIPSESIPPDMPKVLWLRGTLDDAPWKEIAAFRPDACVHTAWVTAPGVYLESPDNSKFLESSLTFLPKLRDFGTQYILGLGTCIEYRIGNEPLSEEKTPLEPTTTYSRCKNKLRIGIEADAAKNGYTFGWARVFYPYGPREHPSRLCSSLIDKLSRGERLTLKTPDSTKDYIFIDDLAEAIVAVTEARFAGAINLGTGIGITVRQIAGTIVQMIERDDLIDETNPPEVDPLGYVVADAARLKGLGWKPAHDLRRGLEKLLAFRNSKS